MSAARGKVDLDVVTDRCQSLKLVHAAECLAELVEEASREDLSPVNFLDRVLEREIERKDERRIATSLRLSGLPVGKTFEGFDWTFQPRIDRSKLEALATCAFVREADNVLFMGPASQPTQCVTLEAGEGLLRPLRYPRRPALRPCSRAGGSAPFPARPDG